MRSRLSEESTSWSVTSTAFRIMKPRSDELLRRQQVAEQIDVDVAGSGAAADARP